MNKSRSAELRQIVNERRDKSMRHVKRRNTPIRAPIIWIRTDAAAACSRKHFAVHVVNRFRECVSKPQQQSVTEAAIESCLQRVVTRVAAVCAGDDRTTIRKLTHEGIDRKSVV